MSKIYSSPEQLRRLARILANYMKTPFAGDSVPGAIMEHALAHVRGGRVLNNYDFIDVIDDINKIGWQVKSTKEETPITWKRAKIPNRQELIEESLEGESGCQKLGDTVIEHCNGHAVESFNDYGLESIGFARLIVRANGGMTYYEKILCSNRDHPVFNKDEFEWKWSEPKRTVKKEQLSALHGTKDGKKWFAWHGRGENQFHFYGEKDWWPDENSNNRMDFDRPSTQLSLDEWTDMLERL